MSLDFFNNPPEYAKIKGHASDSESTSEASATAPVNPDHIAALDNALATNSAQEPHTPLEKVGAGAVTAAALPAAGLAIDYLRHGNVDKSLPPYTNATGAGKNPGFFARLFGEGTQNINYHGVESSQKVGINDQVEALKKELKALQPERGVVKSTGAEFSKYHPKKTPNEILAMKGRVAEARAGAGPAINRQVGDVFAHAPLSEYKPPLDPVRKIPIDPATGNPPGKTPTSNMGKAFSFLGRRVLPGAAAGYEAYEAADAYKQGRPWQAALHGIGAAGSAMQATGVGYLPGTIASIGAPLAAYGLDLLGVGHKPSPLSSTGSQ